MHQDAVYRWIAVELRDQRQQFHHCARHSPANTCLNNIIAGGLGLLVLFAGHRPRWRDRCRPAPPPNPGAVVLSVLAPYPRHLTSNTVAQFFPR